MTIRPITLGAALALCATVSPLASQTAPRAKPTVSIADVIAMRRIGSPWLPGASLALSPDGSTLAMIVWRGDLERNVNVYSLCVLRVADARHRPRAMPEPVLTVDFAGDPADHNATPITRLRLLGDNRTVVFVGTLRGEPRQVYAVDAVTRAVRPLTRHPGDVLDYALDAAGHVRLYAAALVDDTDTFRLSRVRRDGVSIWDATLFPSRSAVAAHTLAFAEPRVVWQYFWLPTGSDTPRLVYDARQVYPKPGAPSTTPYFDTLRAHTAWASYTHSFKVVLAEARAYRERGTAAIDPTGRYAVIWPYARAEHPMRPDRYAYYKGPGAAYFSAAPFGLVDLTTGAIASLLDAPHAYKAPGAGPPIWSPDGRSVLVHILPPFDAEWSGDDSAAARTGGAWVEVDVTTRQRTPVRAPAPWRVQGWNASTNALMLINGTALATMQKRARGAWGALTPIGQLVGMNPRYEPASDGRVVLGVQEDLTMPAEMALYDLASRRTTVLTDLNPWLKTRRYGSVEKIRWRSPHDTASFGYLIKPVDYVPRTRYPLAVLLKDSGWYRPDTADNSFLIDGQWQLTGYAIQTLAASGLVVLFTPPSLGSVIETPAEGEHMVAHIERAIAHLNALGLVDTTRIALSGFSRAGYWTHYTLMHSRMRFAAASVIDGGSSEYNDRGRPFTDAELARLQTPLLFEAHGGGAGDRGLAKPGAMIDRLVALGRPAEAYIYSTAPHITMSPRHRWRSLSTNTDWFRFWLQQYEDPDPAKREQYARWRRWRDAAVPATR